MSELRSFLGMLAALTNFIPKLSTLAHPLYELLGNKPWKWSPSCDKAFCDVKCALTSETVLTHYNPSLPVELAVDASPYGLGAVIMHELPNGDRRPMACASRTLNEHEKRYGQIDKEALAIIFGLKRFHIYLYGHISPLKQIISLWRKFLLLRQPFLRSQRCVYNVGRSYFQLSTTALGLFRPSKMLSLSRYHDCPCRQHLIMGMLFITSKSD